MLVRIHRKTDRGNNQMGGSYEVDEKVKQTGLENVDPRILDILKTTAERAGYRIAVRSGFRPGDKRFHGRGMAADFELIDKDGKRLNSYKDEQTFATYEKFAQDTKRVQMEKYPELDEAYRWGRDIFPDANATVR